MITADFSSTSAHTVNASAPLWQYDYGQTLEIVGLDLPTASEVHFGIEGDDSAVVTEIATSSGGVATCAIPDSILAEGSVHDYVAFAYVYVAEDGAGTTLKRVRMFVKARPIGDTDAATDRAITSDLQKAIDDAVALINEAYASGVTATKESLGLGNVDNTADADKSVASAAKLTTAQAIDGVIFDGSAAVTHYGTCSTAAATVAKTVSVANFTLVAGARVLVRFSYANTASSPTLNVNSTGAKSIRYRNAAVPASYIQQYGVYEFVYSGTYWYIEGDMTGYRLEQVESAISNVDNTADADKSVSYATTAGTADTATSAGTADTATSAGTLTTARAIDGVSFDGSAAVTHYGTCSTAAATVAKTVSVANFTLVAGARVLVRFSYANTASSPTLNVNSTGAKSIRYRNAAVPASYIQQYGVYEFVYSGTYWYLTGDVTHYLYSQLSESLASLQSTIDSLSALSGMACSLRWSGLATTALFELGLFGEDALLMVKGIFSSDGANANCPDAPGEQIYWLTMSSYNNYNIEQPIGSDTYANMNYIATYYSGLGSGDVGSDAAYEYGFTSTAGSSTAYRFYFTGIYWISV